METHFLTRLAQVHSRCVEVGQGCKFRSTACLRRLPGPGGTILSYRRGFRQLPSAAQDRDLLWVFGGPKGIQVTGLEANSIDEEAPPTKRHRPNNIEEAREEVTAPSGADEPHEPPEASIPEGEVASATESASDPHEPPKAAIPEG